MNKIIFLLRVILIIAALILIVSGYGLGAIALLFLVGFGVMVAIAAIALSFRRRGAEFYDQYRQCSTKECKNKILVEPPYQDKCEACRT